MGRDRVLFVLFVLCLSGIGVLSIVTSTLLMWYMVEISAFAVFGFFSTLFMIVLSPYIYHRLTTDSVNASQVSSEDIVTNEDSENKLTVSKDVVAEDVVDDDVVADDECSKYS